MFSVEELENVDKPKNHLAYPEIQVFSFWPVSFQIFPKVYLHMKMYIYIKLNIIVYILFCTPFFSPSNTCVCKISVKCSNVCIDVLSFF